MKNQQPTKKIKQNKIETSVEVLQIAFCASILCFLYLKGNLLGVITCETGFLRM